MKTLTKYDLRVIFSAANKAFQDLNKSDMDSQEFMTLAYCHAVANFLNVEIELKERVFATPVEE